MLVCTMYVRDWSNVRRCKWCEEEDTCLYVRCMYLCALLLYLCSLRLLLILCSPWPVCTAVVPVFSTPLLNIVFSMASVHCCCTCVLYASS